MELQKALTDAAPLIFVFSILHQAIIDLAKTLFGIRTRQYYRAMNYIVFGRDAAEVSWWERLASLPFSVPYDVSGQEGWKLADVSQLIDSFILRGLGDKADTEVTDSDVRNVVAVVRGTYQGPGAVLDLLDRLIQREVDDPKLVKPLLQHRRTAEDAEEPDWSKRVGEWIEELNRPEDPGPTPVRLRTWADDFSRDFLPAEQRARTGLRNALKAAEYRYHHGITQITLVLALVEAWLICWLLILDDALAVTAVYRQAAVFIAAFGALNVLPRGTKSVLDLIMGLGNRLRL